MYSCLFVAQQNRKIYSSQNNPNNKFLFIAFIFYFQFATIALLVRKKTH